MRIALVVERFEPQGGGVECVAWNLAQQLAKLGEEVHVVARCGTPQPGIEMEWVQITSIWQPLRVLAFARRSAAVLRSLAPDVSHALAQVPGCDVFHAGGGSHAAYIANTYSAWGRTFRRGSPRHATLLALQRRIYCDRRQIVECASSDVRDEIAARFGTAAERLAIVPPGVDTERFVAVSDAQRSATRAQLGAGDAPVWLFAGSGWRRKGLDTAISALALSRDARTQLWVAGKDAPSPWRGVARRSGVADRVRFLGLRADLDRLYAAADALVFPTRYDGFGLVCLEAAACSLPVVTSKRAGAWELLRDAAILVDTPEDPRAFARALDRLRTGGTDGTDGTDRTEGTDGLARKLGNAGRRTALESSWPQYAARVRELYASLAAKRASQPR